MTTVGYFIRLWFFIVLEKNKLNFFLQIPE